MKLGKDVGRYNIITFLAKSVILDTRFKKKICSEKTVWLEALYVTQSEERPLSGQKSIL